MVLVTVLVDFLQVPTQPPLAISTASYFLALLMLHPMPSARSRQGPG